MKSADPFVATLQNWIEVFMRRSMKNFILFTKESGLSMSQVGALFRIHKGANGVTDIGEELGVTSAAASQMVERLVQQKLIVRTEDTHDRRVKQILLTPKGLETLEMALHARQDWLVELADALSPEEKDQVSAALKVLTDKALTLGETIGPDL
jgi:DNA-binding MarR family transcriptional regulator